MSIWLKTRIAMFIWGFSVIYFFTGNINLTSKTFLVQALGNTLILYLMVGRHETNK